MSNDAPARYVSSRHRNHLTDSVICRIQRACSDDVARGGDNDRVSLAVALTSSWASGATNRLIGDKVEGVIVTCEETFLNNDSPRSSRKQH